MTKLYVGNLPYSTTNQDLADMFAAYGAVTSATIINDRFSGKSKGFGFVELEDDAKAQEAIQALNGTSNGGRNLVVSVARPKEDRPQRDFGGGRRGRGGLNSFSRSGDRHDRRR